MGRRWGRAGLLMVAASLVVGCQSGTPQGGEEEGVSVSAEPEVSTTSAPAPEETPEAVDPAEHLADEALLDQVSWVLGLLEPGAEGPQVDRLGERFAPEFLEQVPAFQLALVFPQLRAGGPYTVTGVESVPGVGRTAVLTLDADEPLIMTITLDEDDRISGLLFVPDTSGEAPQISSWTDLDDAFAELGGTTQVVVGRVQGGTCTPVHTTEGVEEGGEPAPTGSVFKLMVLAALADAVEAGELDWDDELTITDEVKSLPSGILQERESGSTVTVREAGELMISISDNTATDLLIGELGQERLARSMQDAGVEADRLLPLQTTKQLFILGWGVDQDVRDEFAAAPDPEGRAAVLEGLPTDLSVVDITTVTTPVWQDGADWELTGAEICQVHARLQALAATEAGAPVREILAVNPGGKVPEGVTYQGFKGGSAPGVLALSYYLETGDEPGDGYVLSVQTRGEGPIDQLRAGTIAEAGLRHLAATGD